MKKSDYRTHDNVADEEMLMSLSGYDDHQMDEDFTGRVMEQIRQTEVLPVSNGSMAGYTSNHGRRRFRRNVLWAGLGTAAIALAVLLFLLPDLSALQQIQSSKSQRLLILPSEWSDHHLLEAKKAGVVKLPDIEVTDQGYTLTLQEVVADPNRMILNLRITDAKGQPDEEMMSMFDITQLQLRNEEGLEIGDLQGINHMSTKLGPDKFRIEYLLLTYYFKGEQPGDTVFIEGKVHELMLKYKTNDRISGNWSFSYAADMTTANALTVNTDLSKYSYTTPQGLEILMKGITHSPAGAKIEFSTLLKDELASQVPENRRVNLGVRYHFENAKGQIVGSLINSKYGGMSEINRVGHDLQLNWSYYLTELPYLSEPIYFVLDGFSIPVESDDSLTFNPALLKTKPAVFAAEGDILNVNNIKITETQTLPGLSAWMAVSGKFSNEFDMDKWMARDGNGTEYDVIRWGSYREGDLVTFGQSSGNSDLVYLIVDGMKSIPKELTLIRTVTDKLFNDADWSFELPRSAATSQ
ncbi:hypothetical protein P40081_16665 [Paenibacillus sp. FSL P4-0081]|uniref:DUF4179 domain-containing protein n=1 Tax=Paenibacillus sp. FSL P4-0081 TaxID=1536769 RepID=UPI0004F75B58|nr:DUF4179 domain-containing protein [Paenibacillus sp. FSL P4-0081]AIQ29609.1 hypothetical protein P40081_16665 [Paenibacillus sp. FSL P4-0081]